MTGVHTDEATDGLKSSTGNLTRTGKWGTGTRSRPYRAAGTYLYDSVTCQKKS